MGFSYHSNVLSISASAGVLGGSFTVSDFLISSGQDPSQLNKKGDVHTLDMSQSPPALDFVVGRHKTDAVSDFWNHYVEPYQTTANDTPDSLNFAFTGSLVIELSNPPVTATINDIAIGQGSYTGSYGGTYGMDSITNWWFGGKTCSYESNWTAKCYGIDQNGNILYFHFQRQEKDTSSQMNTLFLENVSYSP